MDIKHAPTDDELTESFLLGCSESFDELVRRYETKVFNTALYLTCDVQSAERILQRVFVAMHQQLANDFGKTPMFKWLLQFTLDESVSELLRSKEENGSERVFSEGLDSYRESFEHLNTSFRFKLHKAVCSLPEGYRNVFLMRDILGLSTSETAKMLCSTVFDVRGTLHEARLLIRDALELGESREEEAKLPPTTGISSSQESAA